MARLVFNLSVATEHNALKQLTSKRMLNDAHRLVTSTHILPKDINYFFSQVDLSNNGAFNRNFTC